MNSPRQSLPNRDSKSPIGDSQVNHKKYKEFAARLSQSAENVGYNAFRLGQQLGVARASMARYWSGERIVPTELIFRLSEILDVDAKWLATGGGNPDGQILDANDAEKSEARLIHAFRKLNPDQQENIIQSADLMSHSRTLHSGRGKFRAFPTED